MVVSESFCVFKNRQERSENVRTMYRIQYHIYSILYSITCVLPNVFIVCKPVCLISFKL